MEHINVLIDCDPGIDDLLALTYALAHPQVKIKGLVASGGNTSTEQVARNIRGILELAGRQEIPWELGAAHPLAQELETTPETHGPRGVGYAKLPDRTTPTGKSHGEGARLWIDTVSQHPGEMIGIVLGPTTNLALALQQDPSIVQKLKALYIMGGAINHRGNTMPTTEWNVHSDPEALHSVLRAYSQPGLSHYPVLCPLDCTESIVMTPGHRQALVAGGGTVLEAIDQALEFYMQFHESDGLGYIAHVHDPYVTALAINDALQDIGDADAHILGSSTQTVLDVELDGKLTRGQTIADWLGRWGREPNGRVLTSTEPEKFFAHYIHTVRAAYAR
ncbi:nucleoside hydrolase [Rothia terrae]|uniref:nucleoside hydrolase n=1 Tax=Rothia terrae TaxID=396015 RepID=UPI001447E5F2|nr:nucleoside hydrolase [Rothia terrae]NKZ34926.1 nucleoside hydrolase [Rothia terrae]